jgi:hypothetical protein
MKYRVITMAPLGDGALLVRCQEPATWCLESSFAMLFCILICFILTVNHGDPDQWIRAFSLGFKHLIKITHT